MPKPHEQRAIYHFIRQYNSFGDPKITGWNLDPEQESPDAILTLGNGQKVALEHTSAFPPKASHVEYLSPLIDLTPVQKVLERKFLNHYRGYDQELSWLLMQIRPTIPLELVMQKVESKSIPNNFDAVYLQWPILYPEGPILGIYELRSRNLWLPNQPAA